MEKGATATKYKIGDQIDGGIVFYVDASGEHGLLAAPVDQNTTTRWYNGTNTLTMAFRNGLGQGAYNTEKIIGNQGSGDYAAIQCARYLLNGHGDWYLPSIYELDLMYKTIGNGGSGPNRNIGKFASSYYWSSTEKNTSEVFVCPFNSGGQVAMVKGTETIAVRAIRAF